MLLPSACPNIFELNTGDYLAVGRDVTAYMRRLLPVDAGCAEDEAIVLLPQRVVVLAAPEILAA
ncbi:hypothetical protein [Phytohabitans rumicis]|uniref:Uncharacterized protein n=1 Tax=Phytohabitans rumicis TaxID=1076125 RepID=A0A6V8LC62_9ACTN|nr:hypothetical protein [Phytohabitans rumicis]GFJ92588.1 hypothetical protein Prum_062300 [Phytohabitans rumicis]